MSALDLDGPARDPDEPLARDVEEAYEQSGHPPGRAQRRADEAAEHAERSGQLDETPREDEKGTGLLEK